MQRIRILIPLILSASLVAAPVLADTPTMARQSTPPRTESAKQLLADSMRIYAAMKTFQAACAYSQSFGKGVDMAAKRSIEYAAPNRFKVVSDSHNFVQTSVSDGKQVVEFTNARNDAQTYPAPDSIANVKTMQMQHPMFCGTLLYHFFGGPDKVSELVAQSHPAVSYGPDTAIDGVVCKTVRFYATGLYGNASIAISPADHLVRRITYDSAPLVKVMLQQAKEQNTPRLQPNMFKSMSTSETYSKIVVDTAIPDTTFTASIPAGMNVEDMSSMSESKPPVPLGSDAPDFTVKDLHGKSYTLSSFRGRPIMLDFWATWCPPCRKSLPETDRIYRKYGSQSLTVMTISDEDIATIAAFVKKNHYAFPAYRDDSDAASKAYNVSAIPTLVFIDAEGKLVGYYVGLQDPDTIDAALKKAGID